MISGYRHDVDEVCVCLGFCTVQNGSVESQRSIEQVTKNSSAAVMAISIKMMNVFHLKQLSKTNIQLPEWLILVLSISFIHSSGVCRIRRFLAVLRSFFHSSLSCTFSCHLYPPTVLPSSLTSSCHLFLGLPVNLVVPKFIFNTLFGILFSYILCTTNVMYLTLLSLLQQVFFFFFKFLYQSISSSFLFPCHTGPSKYFVYAYCRIWPVKWSGL